MGAGWYLRVGTYSSFYSPLELFFSKAWRPGEFEQGK
jgi:hypothetical protein